MISVIIPFYNEQDSLPILIPKLVQNLKTIGEDYEIVLVNDGSQDDYFEKIKNLINKKIKLISMNRQMGKGKALVKGIDFSNGDTIVFMDADLQDDPQDLKKMIDKLNLGYDLVNGYRFERKDNLIVKTYSKLAGSFLRNILKSPFSDINCGFKAFRRRILEDVTLYGNNFRFLPLATFYEGYKVSEVKVINNPRVHGKSKYGIGKIFIGVLDMFIAYFLYKFSERPLHFFGAIGSFFLLVGGLALSIVTYQRIFMGVLLYNRPLLQYSIFLVILGIQIIMTGIIGELIVYFYHKKK